MIDTPGIRSFGLWDIRPEDLAGYFPEFQSVPGRCRFADCTHRHEPKCRVRAAVETGDVAAARYDTYVRLYEDVTAR